MKFILISSYLTILVLILNSKNVEAALFDSVINFIAPKKKLEIQDWNIQSCGGSDGPLALEYIDVSVNARDEFVLSGRIHVRQFLSAPLTVKVNMERKLIGIWVKIPCIRDFGSCTYQDLCDYGYDETEPCPESYVQEHSPCRCPLEKGSYNVPSNVTIAIPKTRLADIAKGNFRATIHFSHNNVALACYNAKFRLKSSKA
ncbi:ganglioside GM2 activator-like [Periplaneta americana]|uniref:ganglioside GM2 activator-like n=1 Tax=Periplaneta americana TaxID=6978 RepID=UPI0037E8D8B0